MSINEEISQLEARRMEVAQYDSNISMYESIIASLPSEWPARLAQFKGRSDHHQAASEVNSSDVELLAQLLYREQCENALRAERMERTKAFSILKVLEARS